MSSAQPILLVLNGVNLNLLGERQPLIYGQASLADLMDAAREAATAAGLAFEHLQSNHEGELVDAIHGARGRCAAIIINAAAFSHYSWALHDALLTFEGPAIEVHISNPNARESWRHLSVISPAVTGVISGLGGHGYVLAVQSIARLLERL